MGNRPACPSLHSFRAAAGLSGAQRAEQQKQTLFLEALPLRLRSGSARAFGRVVLGLFRS
jgi:hypothetical protein